MIEGFWELERRLSVGFSHLVLPRIPYLAPLYGLQLEKTLTLAETVVELPYGIDEEDEVRLLLLTDLHVGVFMTEAAVAQALSRVAEAEPDLVLWSGDFVTSSAGQLEPHLDAISKLRAACGVFGVLGNHDHFGGDSQQLVAMLEDVGVQMLDNASTVVECRSSRFRLAGIDDWAEGRPDLDCALENTGAAADDESVVLMSHQPDAYFEAALRGVDLVLSGHTHGGQLRLPGLPPLVTMSRHRFVDGHYCGPAPSGDPSHLVISRGLGAVQLPLRTWCAPEAVLIRLRAGEAGQIGEPGSG